jgi:hypothetical protein
MNIPGEDGVRPFELIVKAQAAGEGKRVEAMQRFFDALQKRIPGRDTTFAAELETINRETREGLRAVFSAEQFRKFTEMRVELLDVKFEEE